MELLHHNDKVSKFGTEDTETVNELRDLSFKNIVIFIFVFYFVLQLFLMVTWPSQYLAPLFPSTLFHLDYCWVCFMA